MGTWYKENGYFRKNERMQIFFFFLLVVVRRLGGTVRFMVKFTLIGTVLG